MQKNKITLDHIAHHNARRMAFFLNGVDDELAEVPFHWREMKMADHIRAACKFVSTTAKTPLTITVYFCDSYADATDIAKANALPTTAHAKWSINGDLMYLIESEDTEKLTDVLSFFAGRE